MTPRRPTPAERAVAASVVQNARNIPRTCEVCGREFLTSKEALRRGRGHLCSLSCAGRRGGTKAGEVWRGEAKARIGEPYEFEGAMTRDVRLSNGSIARIDSEDAERVGLYTWQRSAKGYAVGKDVGNGGKGVVRMHRLVTNAPPDLLVDHQNRDVLDNRKCNLRLVTPAENSQNRSPGKNNPTGVRGVHWHKGKQQYGAAFGINGKQHFLGYFATIEEATTVVQAARREFMTHSEECQTND